MRDVIKLFEKTSTDLIFSNAPCHTALHCNNVAIVIIIIVIIIVAVVVLTMATIVLAVITSPRKSLHADFCALHNNSSTAHRLAPNKFGEGQAS